MAEFLLIMTIPAVTTTALMLMFISVFKDLPGKPMKRRRKGRR